VQAVDASAITTHGEHTCALRRADETVACWGWNLLGQLGDGSIDDASVPQAVKHLRGARMIAAGGDHTCAALVAGSVECWGSNAGGKLGSGKTWDQLHLSDVPVGVQRLGRVTALALGDYHSCALTPDGAVKCWGTNYRGQLGDGTVVDSSLPLTIPALSRVRVIAAGGYHTCVMTAEGDVYCWGSNAKGELGDRAQSTSCNRQFPTEPCSATPVPVGR
jgi:alpha-tubulin suppressor-like RCC1 family protein